MVVYLSPAKAMALRRTPLATSRTSDFISFAGNRRYGALLHHTGLKNITAVSALPHRIGQSVLGSV